MIEHLIILVADFLDQVFVCLLLYVPSTIHAFSFFLSLYTARPSFEYYRQVYVVHSGLQDESVQVLNHIEITIGFFNLHRG